VIIILSPTGNLTIFDNNGQVWYRTVGKIGYKRRVTLMKKRRIGRAKLRAKAKLPS